MAGRLAIGTVLVCPLLLGACVAMGPPVAIGPSVAVQPGRGRSPAMFAADRSACGLETNRQVQPIADRIRKAALLGVPQPAPISAQVQVLYDQTYGSCMTARGNVVAANGSGQARATVAGNVTYTGLTDLDSIAARQTLASTIEGFRRDCEGERIQVSTLEAVLSETSNARTITLTTPGGGSCFGQPGQDTYLVAKVGGARRTLLSAEPGSIQISDTKHNGYGDAEVHSLGLCVYYYRWNGTRYVQASARDCATAAPPTMSTLPRAIRRN